MLRQPPSILKNKVMQMEFVKRNGVAVAVLDRSERLDSVQAALDVLAGHV